jgi:hypothetical protein
VENDEFLAERKSARHLSYLQKQQLERKEKRLCRVKLENLVE